MRYIRRVSLDVMWSRTKGTVRSTFNRMRKDCAEANDVLSVGQIFPRMGNPEMVDKDGMGLAIIMLHASLRKGVYRDHLQFDTVRKTVSWAWQAWTAIERGEEGREQLEVASGSTGGYYEQRDKGKTVGTQAGTVEAGGGWSGGRTSVCEQRRQESEDERLQRCLPRICREGHGKEPWGLF